MMVECHVQQRNRGTACSVAVVPLAAHLCSCVVSLTFSGGNAVGFLGLATSQMMMSPSAPPEASRLGLS